MGDDGLYTGSTASFQLPDIPTDAIYGVVTNTNNFTVAIDGGTVTLTTNEAASCTPSTK